MYSTYSHPKFLQNIVHEAAESKQQMCDLMSN